VRNSFFLSLFLHQSKMTERRHMWFYWPFLLMLKITFAQEECPPLNAMTLYGGYYYYSDPAFSNFSQAREICEDMLGLVLAPLDQPGQHAAAGQAASSAGDSWLDVVHPTVILMEANLFTNVCLHAGICLHELPLHGLGRGDAGALQRSGHGAGGRVLRLRARLGRRAGGRGLRQSQHARPLLLAVQKSPIKPLITLINVCMKLMESGRIGLLGRNARRPAAAGRKRGAGRARRPCPRPTATRARPRTTTGSRTSATTSPAQVPD